MSSFYFLYTLLLSSIWSPIFLSPFIVSSSYLFFFSPVLSPSALLPHCVPSSFVSSPFSSSWLLLFGFLSHLLVLLWLCFLSLFLSHVHFSPVQSPLLISFLSRRFSSPTRTSSIVILSYFVLSNLQLPLN